VQDLQVIPEVLVRATTPLPSSRIHRARCGTAVTTVLIQTLLTNLFVD